MAYRRPTHPSPFARAELQRRTARAEAGHPFPFARAECYVLQAVFALRARSARCHARKRVPGAVFSNGLPQRPLLPLGSWLLHPQLWHLQQVLLYDDAHFKRLQ